MRSREAFVFVRAVAFRVGYRIDDEWRKKKCTDFESLSLLFPFEREDECLVAPDHDAPSRVLNRLGFAAFVLDFPDVCRKKEKRRNGGGASARVSVVFFERETRSSIPNVVFLALLSSLSFFQKSDDETAFQIPPRDARAREKERVERERETTQ